MDSHELGSDFSFFKNVLRNLSFFFEAVSCITLLGEDSVLAKLMCLHQQNHLCHGNGMDLESPENQGREKDQSSLWVPPGAHPHIPGL